MHTLHHRRRALAAAASVLLALLILACGGGEAVTPTRVGQVEPASASDSAPPAADGREAPPTAAPATAQEPAAAPTAAAPTEYAIGDIIALGDLRLVVLGWSLPEPTDFITPDAGNRFVAVDLLVVNAGQKPAAISSLLQMTLKDESGQAYQVDISAAQAARKDGIDGVIVPGERVRGTAAFQAPEDAGGLTFVYDADVFGAGKLFVALGEEPAVVDAPAQLEGERALQVAQVGEALQVGTLTLTVNGAERVAGGEFVKPEDGAVFLVVDVTLENTGAEAVHVSSLAQAALKDASGQRYAIDISATTAAQGKSPDGEIAPGEKLRGPIGFQVPADAEGLLFVYLGDAFGGEKVFVQLPG